MINNQRVMQHTNIQLIEINQATLTKCYVAFVT